MTVTVERREAVVVVTIDRAGVHNCVDTPTALALEEAVRSFDDDDELRVLVLTGAGTRAFSSGADLKDPPRGRAGPMGISRLAVSKPTVAAINGYCYAGGLELAAWCDFRICDETATFGVLNRRWGVPLIDGGTQRLPRVVGLGNALYLIETGVRIDASVALRMGLVQEVTSPGAALERAVELAGHIAHYPQASLRADRTSAILADGIDAEARRGAPTVSDPETQAGFERFRAGDRPSPPSGA